MQVNSLIALNNTVRMPVLAFGVYRMTPEEAARTASWALEYGYRHLDTASYYKNEKAVGQAVRASGLRREDLFVTSKVWVDDIRKERVEAAIEESLHELRMDYLDLYLVHWPVGDIAATWKAMERVLAAGKARAVGVSNFQRHHLETVLRDCSVVPAVNQVETHPYFTQEEALDCGRRHGIVTQSRSPLGGQKAMQPDVKKDPAIEAVAVKHGKSTAQVILRWHLQRGCALVTKSLRRERILDNSKIFDFSLSEEEMRTISGLNRNLRTGSDPDNLKY